MAHAKAFNESNQMAFGGAAGQHACLVADALGMQTVYIHPLAGVLSAYGIGLADVTAMKQQAVESELSDATLAALQSPWRCRILSRIYLPVSTS